MRVTEEGAQLSTASLYLEIGCQTCGSQRWGDDSPKATQLKEETYIRIISVGLKGRETGGGSGQFKVPVA